MSEGGIKHDGGKIPLELLDRVPMEAIAEVFDFGAKKYGRYNYKKGLAYSRLIGAAQRHLTAFNSGEDLDLESGKSHLAHLGCCIFMLLEQLKSHPELDDRYKKSSSDSK